MTRRANAREVDGAHEHMVFNPAGIVVSIGCFAEAPGAVPTTAPFSTFAWFSGWV